MTLGHFEKKENTDEFKKQFCQYLLCKSPTCQCGQTLVSRLFTLFQV